MIYIYQFVFGFSLILLFCLAAIFVKPIADEKGVFYEKEIDFVADQCHGSHE